MTGEDSKELVALREALRNEQADYESWEFYHAPENGSRESERRERRERSYPQRVASERLHRLDRLRQLRTRIEVLEREKAIQDSKTSIADQIQKSIQDILSNPEVAPSGPLVSLDTLETILMRHPVYGYQDEPVSPEEGGTRIPGAVRFLNEAYSSDFAVRHGLLADLMVSFQRAAARHPVVKNDDCLHLLVLLVYRLGLPTYDKTGKPATFPDELSASLNLSARWARLSEVDATLCRYGWPALPIEHSLSPTVPQGAAQPFEPDELLDRPRTRNTQPVGLSDNYQRWRRLDDYPKPDHLDLQAQDGSLRVAVKAHRWRAYLVPGNPDPSQSAVDESGWSRDGGPPKGSPLLLVDGFWYLEGQEASRVLRRYTQMLCMG